MELVSSRQEIDDNVQRLRAYVDGAPIDRELALDLVQRGICFVVTEAGRGAFFAPSRFVGYANNSRDAHTRNTSKDGRVTNEALEAILGGEPIPNKELEDQYEAFCIDLGGKAETTPFARRRKFWDIRGPIVRQPANTR